MPEKEGLVLVRGKAVALRKRTVADIQMFLKWRRLNCQAPAQPVRRPVGRAGERRRVRRQGGAGHREGGGRPG